MFVNSNVVASIAQMRLNNEPGKPDARAFKMLLEMGACESIDFYLTGSRFFGSSFVLSDWDFFVAHTPHTEAWLTNKGFVALDQPTYAIPQSKQEIATVLQYPPQDVVKKEILTRLNEFYTAVYTNGEQDYVQPTIIQVQLIADAVRKNKLQIAVNNSFLKDYLVNKWTAKLIWEALFVGESA